MPRPIFTLLAELQSTLAELKNALDPIARITGLFRGNDGPFPMTRVAAKKRGRRKTRKAPAPNAAKTSAATTDASAKPASKRKAHPRFALQGRYMSALRGLSKADQAEVKRVNAEKGVEAALKVAAAKAS
ncbi:MAG: hypothetical protein ABIT01_08765 [Thermoanaerobaculia bacterium]